MKKLLLTLSLLTFLSTFDSSALNITGTGDDIYAPGGDDKWGFGYWEDKKKDCTFFPFWLCKGGWNNPYGIWQTNNTETTIAYIEDGKFVLEVYVNPDNIQTVLNSITNGLINFSNVGTGEDYISIPPSLVQNLNLSTDKIYPGSYPAHRVENTNRIKINF